MSIGTPQQLRDAAQGKMPRKNTPPPESPEPPANNAYRQALTRRSTLGTSAAQRLQTAAPEYAAGVYTGGRSGDLGAMQKAAVPATSPTPMLGKILRGLTASRGGLSSEGKYGGFYSAEDLSAAIRGAAIGSRETYVPELRRKAFARYNELDPMYGQAQSSAIKTELPRMGFKSQAPASAAGFRQFEEVSSFKPEPLRQYASQLSDWYAENAKPAEEYLATAQQLESVPLSDLAQQIAVSQYGMNPDLARSKFAGLDADYWKSKRDQEYVNVYGVPYDEFQAIKDDEATRFEEQQDRARTTQERSTIANVENLTGFKASTFGNLIGRTPAQVAEAATQEAKFTNDEGDEVIANGVWAIQRAKNLIAADPENGINQVNQMVREAEESNQPDIAALLVALMSMSGYNIQRLQNRIYLAGLTEEP